MKNKPNPRTAIFEVRCDARTVAALYLFFKDKGVPVTSRSALGHEVFESLAEILKSNGLIATIDNTEDADEILASALGAGIRRSGRGERNYLKQIALEKADVVKSDVPAVSGDFLSKLAGDEDET